jgi:hypothetical protein
MENNIETFKKELNSIIGICDEKIKHYKAFVSDTRLSEYPHYVSLINRSTYPFLNANPRVHVRYEVERVHL